MLGSYVRSIKPMVISSISQTSFHLNTAILSSLHSTFTIPMARSQKAVAASSSKRKAKQSFNRYIYKTLKAVHKDIGFSSKGMTVMASFVQDLFERITTEAASLTRYNKAQTMSSREIQTAVRLILPGELAKHAMAEGTKAVAKIAASK